MTSIFAYGSLVNMTTWNFSAESRLHAIDGWIRQWRKRITCKGKKMSVLTVTPCENSTIHGLLIDAPPKVLAAIDRREEGYDRTEIGDQVYLYSANSLTLAWATHDAPIVKSYIDVVAYGYFDLLGADGLHEFFATTQGWHLPVLDDRHAPLYPRWMRMDRSFLAMVDIYLERFRHDDQRRQVCKISERT